MKALVQYSPLSTIVVDPVESRRAAATDVGADLVLSRTTTSPGPCGS